MNGARAFARFAYPPNELGYCGGDDSRELLECAAVGGGGADDRLLRRLATEFHGAWPYLQLIAGANGIADPLDARVVEAYWLGSPLLHPPSAVELGDSLEGRFRRIAGPHWPEVAAAIGSDMLPHHGFHVFRVYPWVGLLREHTAPALRVLDRCRIRSGTVLAVDGETATVAGRPLTYDGTRLLMGSSTTETVRVARDGYRLGPRVRPGDLVAVHWDWICTTIGEQQRAWLERLTARELRRCGAMAVDATPIASPP